MNIFQRAKFVAAYPRETQEMVLDAHIRAFAFFGGVPKRMVYDNRRFLTLANHYLFEPVACTPESGWEKGQVENQVGNIREWLFTPTPKFQDFTALISLGFILIFALTWGYNPLIDK
jgi:transposase